MYEYRDNIHNWIANVNKYHEKLFKENQRTETMSDKSTTTGDPVINVQPPSPPSVSPAPDHQDQTTYVSNSAPVILTYTVPPITDQPKQRKVSIASDLASEKAAYDNMAFESGPKRKTSQLSMPEWEGPLRRKSILLNSNDDKESSYSHHSNDIPKLNGEHMRRSKMSTTESIHSHRNRRDNLTEEVIQDNLRDSWIFALCMRCRVEYNTPSWEPPHWQKVCPYPFCPSFRQFSRIFSLLLIGALAWVCTYEVVGKTAAPGGQLFGLVVLTVTAHFGGWLISLTTLPRLIGMLIVGLIFGNLYWVDFSGEFSHVTAILRKFALVIILTRAGLEMDPAAFKKVYVQILKLGLIPWLVETIVVAVLTNLLLGLPWLWAFGLGTIVSAVSPAVVVPCLFRLRSKGYGVAKGIPTLIVAVAGIDDAASVAGFGIISSIIFSAGDLGYQISQLPVCVIGGLAFGVLWGYLCRFVPEKGDAYVVPLRILMLFIGGLFAVFGSEMVGYEGAGPLAVVFGAFTSNYFWIEQGWELEDNPASTGFEIFWMLFEPILFGITGASIRIAELDGHVVSIGIGCLLAGIIIRVFVTVGIAVGDGFNLKEKIFIALSWMAKATVQAALGPVAIKQLTSRGDVTDDEKYYAETIFMICVLSIILTAPIGAIIISITGPRLLTKTKQPHIVEGWRRSHRPSLYDISIIDEAEERDDPETAPDNKTVANTNTNANMTSQPFYTITQM